jgi:lichenan operon transcriptional antiterminator
MLTKRQTLILSELNKNAGEWVKANSLADLFNVSLRTVQNDIKTIKKFVNENDISYHIESKVPFGTRLIIDDASRYAEDLQEATTQIYDANLNDKESRIQTLLHFLMDQHKSVSISRCAESIYVSEIYISDRF